MFDIFFDNGIIFIAIAIFIGRLVLQLWRRGGQEREKTPSPASELFEREEEDEAEEIGRRISYSRTRDASDFLREIVMREAAMEAAPRPPPPPRAPEILPAVPLPSKQDARPPREENRPAGAEAAGFPASLERFSPLKRAVILAEILGPPKGL
jgi:hypothetical protein